MDVNSGPRLAPWRLQKCVCVIGALATLYTLEGQQSWGDLLLRYRASADAVGMGPKCVCVWGGGGGGLRFNSD